MHIYIRAKEWAHWAFLKLFHVHLHMQENALWTSPEWSGPVQNLDSRDMRLLLMSGHAVQIFWSGQPCTSVWTRSGPNLDRIWNRAKTVWTNFGNHPILNFDEVLCNSHMIFFLTTNWLQFLQPTRSECYGISVRKIWSVSSSVLWRTSHKSHATYLCMVPTVLWCCLSV